MDQSKLEFTNVVVQNLGQIQVLKNGRWCKKFFSKTIYFIVKLCNLINYFVRQAYLQTQMKKNTKDKYYNISLMNRALKSSDRTSPKKMGSGQAYALSEQSSLSTVLKFSGPFSISQAWNIKQAQAMPSLSLDLSFGLKLYSQIHLCIVFVLISLHPNLVLNSDMKILINF